MYPQYIPTGYTMPYQMPQPQPQGYVQQQQNNQGNGGQKNGLSQSQKRGRNYQNNQKNGNSNQKNNKKAKNSNGKNNNNVVLDKNTVNQIAQAVNSKKSAGESTSKPAAKANIMIGSFQNFLADVERQKEFMAVYKKSVNNKLRFFPADSVELPLYDVAEIKVLNLIVKFDASWFADVARSLPTTDTKLKTYQIFDACYTKIESQLAKIKAHYKPSGVIFIVCESKNIYDTVAGAVALDNAMPIIQIGQYGKKAVNADFTVRDLAHRIVEIVKTYREPINLENSGPAVVSGIVNFDDL